MSIWNVAHGLDKLEHELTLQVLETEFNDDKALFLQSQGRCFLHL
jgi:hypothetical protein